MSIASEIARINANVAAAYSKCGDKGANLPQLRNSANLADAIDSIPQGGAVGVPPKYVNFIDTDGTILYSYTDAEIQALTALPPLPTKSGYTYQEWNWSLADIKAYRFPLTVGAVRIPSDGKTCFTFDLMYGGNLTLTIPFTVEPGGEVAFDWGDGTSDVFTSGPAVHTYASFGRYDVRIGADRSYSLIGFSSNIALYSTLVKADIGSYLSLGSSASPLFYNCINLEKLSIPVGKTVNTLMLYQCSSIKSFTLPSTSTLIPSCYACRNLKTVSLPNVDLACDSNSFMCCETLKRISFPKELTVIKSGAASGCKSLQSIFIPENIADIQSNTFKNCKAVKTIDLSALTTVPTLGDVVFNDCSTAVFYVRNAAMLAAFQSATNWSAYADRMQIGGVYAQA